MAAKELERFLQRLRPFLRTSRLIPSWPVPVGSSYGYERGLRQSTSKEKTPSAYLREYTHQILIRNGALHQKGREISTEQKRWQPHTSSPRSSGNTIPVERIPNTHARVKAKHLLNAIERIESSLDCCARIVPKCRTRLSTTYCLLLFPPARKASSRLEPTE